METCIQPLNFKLKWTKPELEAKTLEHQVFIKTFSFFYVNYFNYI